MGLWSLPNGGASGGRDTLFWRFTLLAFGIVALYSIGMVVVLLFGEDSVALRMLNIFPSLLVSVLSLGSGYLLGQANTTSMNCECPACTEARARAHNKGTSGDG